MNTIDIRPHEYYRYIMLYLPVVPHKAVAAVAEVSE